MAYRNAVGEFADDPLNAYLEKLNVLVEKLSSAEKTKLMRQIGRELQHRNSRRILDNVSPDNVAYVPRKGNVWDLRPLRKTETIRRGQKFNFFKERDLDLAFAKEAISRNGNPMILGRRHEDRAPDWEASGFVREWIYIKAKGRGNQSKLRMFKKLGRKKWLRFKAYEHQAAIGFMNGAAARIAAEHHYGEKKLPERQLIGLPQEDLQYIHDTVWKHIAEHT